MRFFAIGWFAATEDARMSQQLWRPTTVAPLRELELLQLDPTDPTPDLYATGPAGTSTCRAMPCALPL